MHDATNQLAYDLLGCSLLQIERPFWAVKLDDKWLCEAQKVWNIARGEERLLDWTLDLVTTGDVLRIRELWMFCPPNQVSPLGNTARLPIVEPGTAFQFKIGTVDSVLVASEKRMLAMLIGRVDDKVSGACTIFCWDEQMQALFTPMSTTTQALDQFVSPTTYVPWRPNVHTGIGTHRPGELPPQGIPELDVLGVRV